LTPSARLIYNIETYDITTIRASMGMYLVSKYISENTDIKVLMTGEISDEIFGYKYTDFAPTSFEAFQKEAEKRLTEIYMYDVLEGRPEHLLLRTGSKGALRGSGFCDNTS
jgi:asparagine synthase (glutamine-hydrolysing)